MNTLLLNVESIGTARLTDVWTFWPAPVRAEKVRRVMRAHVQFDVRRGRGNRAWKRAEEIDRAIQSKVRRIT